MPRLIIFLTICFFSVYTAVAQQQHLVRQPALFVNTSAHDISQKRRQASKMLINTRPSDTVVSYISGYSPGLSPNFQAGKFPSNYYTTHFGFFCRKELQVEKITGIPFRFRLGSLGYCNMLEGK